MQYPEYIDIHSHLNLPQFDADASEAAARIKEAGIWTITVGVDLASSRKAVELLGLYEGLFATVGLHPCDNHAEAFDAASYEGLAKNPRVVAIGECGLDYVRIKGDIEAEKARQKDIFEKQIALALKLDKPLMLHIRGAYGDALSILESHAAKAGNKLRGDVHFFAGSVEEAKRFVDLGFTLSFTGVITFAPEYHEVLRSLPLTHIMSETDAPFVAPVPHRGKRNEPLYVREVAAAIAEIRGEDPETVKKALVANARRVFGI
jgi:TatD DNase family protein